MINKLEIDNGFKYYNLNEEYKNRCYECAEIINNNVKFLNSFNKVYNSLNFEHFNNVKEYWNIKCIEDMFCEGIDNFVTNLVIVLSYKTHKENLEKSNLDKKQILIHKNRVKECFENDLVKRNYDSVRISQMLWAIYFVRCKIVEIGRLQYEHLTTIDNNACIKIHIPGGEKLDIHKVKDSLNISKVKLKNIFNVKYINYMCVSWLLSNKLNGLIKPDSNIYMFYDLFNVEDGQDCTQDILNFVYSLKECEDYTTLPENTKLQKQIKEELIKGTVFKLGIGTLK